jgi:CBS domain-containing protein
MLVADVMTQGVISVAPDASAMQADALMLKHQISGLPLVWVEPVSGMTALPRETGTMCANAS